MEFFNHRHLLAESLLKNPREVNKRLFFYGKQRNNGRDGAVNVFMVLELERILERELIRSGILH